MFTHYHRFANRNSVEPQRSRLLERLCARAATSAEAIDWRAGAFHLIAPETACMPGLAAVALYGEHGALAGASVFFATPVHYLAEMSNVRLPANGILSLPQADAQALAADFNRVWSGAGFRLLAGRAAHLFCVAEPEIVAATHDPEDVLDGYIENFLPAGPEGRRLRQLMSEIEMWLFEHAVNRNRSARGEPVVNGLWLWGGGAALAALPPVRGWAAGDDPFFSALGGSLAHAPDHAGSGVIVTTAQPGTPRWRDYESRWLEDSIAQLHAGRIARLDLSAGHRRFRVSAGSRWRFWRRPRPWWEYFA